MKSTLSQIMHAGIMRVAYLINEQRGTTKLYEKKF